MGSKPPTNVSRETFYRPYLRRRGLAPGTLLDDEHSHPPKLRLIHYGPDAYEQLQPADLDHTKALMDHEAPVTWLHIQGQPDRALLESLGAHFGIHALTLEDIQTNARQAKTEIFPEYIYVQVQSLHWTGNQLQQSPLHLLLLPGAILSVHTNDVDITETLLQRLQTPHSRMRQKGADYLLYVLMDLAVDQAFPALAEFSDAVQNLEEALLCRTEHHQLAAIQETKRNIVRFSRELWPMRECVTKLSRSLGEHDLLGLELRPFLNDVQDHSVQLMTLLDSQRDVVSGLMDIYLSMVNNRLSDIMRVLTVISTLFIPMTFLTGVYGMNIPHVPLMHAAYGSTIVALLMLAVVLGMLWFFRRRGWIFRP